MSRRRDPSGPAISLFPFLAVLLCTMGALLVVLVIFSRSAAENSRQADDEAASQLEAARASLREKLAELERLERESAGRLSQARLRLAGIEENARKLQDEMTSLQRSLEGLVAARSNATDPRQDAELDQRLAEARDTLERAKAEAGTKPAAYAVVPYEGASGTRRRPLYIECCGDGVFLQPEGIRLKPSDFEGPPGPGNPLASALRAAREHLASRPGTAGTTEAQPYPLLLVRPSGVMAYYAARESIMSWGSEFGYQLVDEDWQLAFPAADPLLADVETRAIEEARGRLQWLAEVRPKRPSRPAAKYRAATTRGGVVSTEGPSVLGDQSRFEWNDDAADRAAGDALGRSGGGYGAGGGSGSGLLGGSNGGRSGGQPSASGGFGGEASGRSGPVGGPSGGLAAGGGTGRFGSGSGGDPLGGPEASGEASGSGSSEVRGSFRGGGSSDGRGSGSETGSSPGAASDRTATSGTGSGGIGSSGIGSGGASVARSAGGSPASAAAAAAGEPAGHLGGQPGAGQPGGNAAHGSVSSESASNGSASNGGASAGSQASGGMAGMATPGMLQPQGGQESGGSGATASVSFAKDRGSNWASRASRDRPIPLHRPVQIECAADEFRLYDDSGRRVATRIPIRGDTATAIDPLVKSVHERVDTWGLAGDRMYWKPQLFLSETPGGTSRRADLERLLADSGLETFKRGSTVAPLPAVAEAGREPVRRTTQPADTKQR